MGCSNFYGFCSNLAATDPGKWFWGRISNWGSSNLVGVLGFWHVGMGLGEADLLEDDGRGDAGMSFAVAAISCSICLEAVKDKGDRSTAKLQCGHEFHLGM